MLSFDSKNHEQFEWTGRLLFITWLQLELSLSLVRTPSLERIW